MHVKVQIQTGFYAFPWTAKTAFWQSMEKHNICEERLLNNKPTYRIGDFS